MTKFCSAKFVSSIDSTWSDLHSFTCDEGRALTWLADDNRFSKPLLRDFRKVLEIVLLLECLRDCLNLILSNKMDSTSAPASACV